MAGIGCGCGKLLDPTCPLHRPIVEEGMRLAEEALLGGVPDCAAHRTTDNPDQEAEMRDDNGHEDHVLKVPAGALGDPDELAKAIGEPGRLIADGIPDMMELLEDCEVLKAQPGDVIVFKPGGEKSDDDLAMAFRALETAFPRNRILVIEPGDTLGAVRIGERE